MTQDLVRIELAWKPVIKRLQEAAAGVANRRGLMSDVAGIMLAAVEDNFDAQGRPPWTQLAPSTIAARREAGYWPGKILQRSGDLVSSMTPFWDNESAGVGTNKVQARILNFGGQTRPHVVRPRQGRALAFGGIVVRQVQHPGSKIPAREFMRLTPFDQREIALAAQEFLWGRIQRAAARGFGEALPW